MYGQPRFLNEGFKYFNIFFNGVDVDYYFHLWKDGDTLKKVNKIYKPKKIIVENQIENLESDFNIKFDLSYTNKDVQTTLSPLLSINKVGKLLMQSKEEYDLVVLTRTDVAPEGLTLKELFPRGIDERVVYTNAIKGKVWKLTKSKKYNKNRKGIDTKFIASTKQNIVELTKIYENLESLISKNRVHFCHHRLFYFTLSKNVKKFKYLQLHQNDYSFGWHIIRENDSGIYLGS
jgi:hypothetical protein